MKILAAVLGGSIVALMARAAEYEEPPVLRANQLAPPELLAGPDWRVDERVPIEGYLALFTIRSAHGDVPAHGRRMLDVRVMEQAAIAKLAKISTGDAFANALKDSAGATVDTFRQAVTNPVETAKNIPSGVGRFFMGVGKGIGRVAQGVADSFNGQDERTATDKAADAGEGLKNAIGYNRARRQLARELGVDPYTTNPVLDSQLERIARAVFFGGLAVDLTIGAVAKPLSYSQAVINMAWDLPPADLNEQNLKKLLALGASEETARAFQRNRNYSLTMQTDLVELLAGMPALKGRAKIIAQAVNAASEDEARYVLGAVGMLRRYHEAVAPLTALDVPSSLPVGVRPDGGWVYPAAVDWLPWTQDVAQRVAESPTKGRPHFLYLMGRATPLARKRFTEAGWTVHENFQP